jgi:glycerophosphoryl diester phosphodiesterase
MLKEMKRIKNLAAASLTLLIGVGAAIVPAQAAEAPIWNSRRFISIAHAGGDLESPHSTLYAMKRAVAAGADVLELDLRFSSDNVLMIQHDETVDRTTAGTGPAIGFTAAELGAMDNAYRFIPNCWRCNGLPDSDYTLRGVRTGVIPPPDGFEPDDFGIPTLLEVVNTFPGQRLNLEIKDGPTGMAAAEALATLIDNNGPVDRYVVASFEDEILAYFKTLAPDVYTSPGLDLVTSWFGSRGPLPGQKLLQVPPFFGEIEVVTQKFVDDAHANGLGVWVWFNDEVEDGPATWVRLMGLGVDGILTGKPAEAEPYIAAANAAAALAVTTTTAPVTTPEVAALANTGNDQLFWALGIGTAILGAIFVFIGRRRPAALSH